MTVGIVEDRHVDQRLPVLSHQKVVGIFALADTGAGRPDRDRVFFARLI